jgi:hypothetical protein
MRIAARPEFHYAASAIQTSKIYMYEGENLEQTIGISQQSARGNYSQFAASALLAHRHYFHVTMLQGLYSYTVAAATDSLLD